MANQFTKLESPKERLMKHVSVNEQTGCWNWTSVINYSGYGKFWIKPYGQAPAHRAAFEIFLKKKPGQKCVLHKCDNRRCVNPKHLYLGDQAMNMKDRQERKRHRNTQKKLCALGHRFTEKNTYLWKAPNGQIWRQCHKCRALRNKQRDERRRQSVGKKQSAN